MSLKSTLATFSADFESIIQLGEATSQKVLADFEARKQKLVAEVKVAISGTISKIDLKALCNKIIETASMVAAGLEMPGDNDAVNAERKQYVKNAVAYAYDQLTPHLLPPWFSSMIPVTFQATARADFLDFIDADIDYIWAEVVKPAVMGAKVVADPPPPKPSPAPVAPVVAAAAVTKGT